MWIYKIMGPLSIGLGGRSDSWSSSWSVGPSVGWGGFILRGKIPNPPGRWDRAFVFHCILVVLCCTVHWSAHQTWKQEPPGQRPSLATNQTNGCPRGNYLTSIMCISRFQNFTSLNTPKTITLAINDCPRSNYAIIGTSIKWFMSNRPTLRLLRLALQASEYIAAFEPIWDHGASLPCTRPPAPCPPSARGPKVLLYKAPDYYTSTQLLYKQPPTIQAPNYYASRQLLNKPPN